MKLHWKDDYGHLLSDGEWLKLHGDFLRENGYENNGTPESVSQAIVDVITDVCAYKEACGETINTGG